MLGMETLNRSRTIDVMFFCNSFCDVIMFSLATITLHYVVSGANMVCRSQGNIYGNDKKSNVS